MTEKKKSAFVVTDLGCSRIFRCKSICKTLLIAMANSFAKHHKASMKLKDSWTTYCILILFCPKETQEMGPHRTVPGQT